MILRIDLIIILTAVTYQLSKTPPLPLTNFSTFPWLPLPFTSLLSLMSNKYQMLIILKNPSKVVYNYLIHLSLSILQRGIHFDTSMISKNHKPPSRDP